MLKPIKYNKQNFSQSVLKTSYCESCQKDHVFTEKINYSISVIDGISKNDYGYIIELMTVINSGNVLLDWSFEMAQN